MDERVAISINVIEKQGLKEPNVAWVRTIQPELVFKSTEEGAPAAAEISANFNPQPLNMSIMGRAEGVV